MAKAAVCLRSVLMKVDISSIRINDRKRKLNDDKVAELAESILLLGLLEPILVTQNGDEYTLLAGLHRLEAAKLLGWKTIEATRYQGDDLECELVEIDENLMNNDLTVLEQGEHIQRRNEILEAMGKRREVGRYPSNDEIFSPLKTTEDIAKEVGLSKRSAQQRTQIARDIVPEVKELIRDTPIADSTTQLLELARMKPDEQFEVAKQSIDGEMNIERAKREIIKEKQKNMPKPELPTGTYEVIYADPPWSYDNSGFNQSAASQYPTMSVDKICQLDVKSLCTDNSILFMWATSPLLPEAFEVIKAWGFEYKASMIWVKDRAPGMGWWVNTKHELLLMASMPSALNVNHPAKKFDSVIEAPVTRHSAKPDVFYELIEEMYAGPKIELFARNKRQGWEASWGNEV